MNDLLRSLMGGAGPAPQAQPISTGTAVPLNFGASVILTYLVWSGGQNSGTLRPACSPHRAGSLPPGQRDGVGSGEGRNP
ncbi:MAG: hypothetical protein KF770_28560 [Anaerolineae bacterium]|nr:hypothetical protein [Anaerolineae bacterium]